ncbi:MAG: carbohydrate-binding domain-containing protein [Bacteroidaceae bacterium]|nr:carbohydrate-binding domain-containing protein [Bacteroidaceae bacterium]
MKKNIAFVLALALATTAQAQVLDVKQGNVTYRYNAKDCGDMTYNNGTSLSIGSRTFSLTDVELVSVDLSNSIKDNSVSVTYSDTKAEVVIAGNIAPYITATVTNGTHVSILEAGCADEITYTLSGSCSNGSFYQDGDLKATFVLNNLSLTNPSGAAINIDDGKRIAIELEGSNSLADGSSNTDKGALMVNGHSEFTGSGTLSIAGNGTKHAFWADEYILLKKTMTGGITITKATKDGINVNQYLKIKGGSLTISGVGDDGIQIGMEGDKSEDDGKFLMSDGTLSVTVPSSVGGGKCVKADSTIVISGGTLTLKAQASSIYDSSTHDYTIGAGLSSDANIDISGGNITISNSGSYSHGIKADGTLSISGGDITTTSSGSASHGIKAETNLNISGGIIQCTTSGAATTKYTSSGSTDYKGCAGINCDGNMTVSGSAYITCTSTGTGGKGISVDGTLTINGGTITSKATGSNYGSNGGGGGWGGGSTSSSSVSAKGIKADGATVINGGETNATSSSHEAFETKSTLTVNDGKLICVSSADDAINSASHMYIKGGYVLGQTSSNDGIDSNGNMYISGGVVLAFGSGSPECGLDAAERYYLYITGGTVIANGGGNNSVSSTTGSQPVIGVSTSLSKFAIETTSSAGSSSILAFDATKLPNGYSSTSGGGGGGGWGGHGPGGGGGGGGSTSSWLISSPSFSTNTTYYIFSSPTINETDDTWYGLTTNAKVSGGSQTTSAKASTTYSGR